MSKKLSDHFDDKPLPGGLTYQAHPACLAAAVACLEVMEEVFLSFSFCVLFCALCMSFLSVFSFHLLTPFSQEKLVENAKNMGEVMKQHHQQIQENHPCVGNVRSIGLFGAIELVKNRETKETFIPFKGANPAMGKVMEFMKENGVIAFNNAQGMLLTIPPLCINEQQLKETFEVVDKALYIADEACTA